MNWGRKVGRCNNICSGREERVEKEMYEEINAWRRWERERLLYVRIVNEWVRDTDRDRDRDITQWFWVHMRAERERCSFHLIQIEIDTLFFSCFSFLCHHKENPFLYVPFTRATISPTSLVFFYHSSISLSFFLSWDVCLIPLSFSLFLSLFNLPSPSFSPG